LVDYYDPDIVERANNMKNNGMSRITVQELYNIKKLLEDYVNNADLDIPVK
jgi:hypothetical protein